VPLIVAGELRGAVHDAASAARAGVGSTGHATQPLTLAPLPEHLLLAGGDAADVAALCAPVARGLFVPALSPGRPHTTAGAARIEAGAIAGAVAPVALELDPLLLLASAEGLTAARRLVALRGHCPGGPGAATVPALLSRAGAQVAAP
jgi:predicted Zn-dependent protease